MTLGEQSRPPLQPSTVPAFCPCPVIPSQCSPRSKCPWGAHWRGNPSPLPQKRKAALPGGSLSLSINPLYVVRGSSTQGELEGAKPASNKIKCRAKPCLARRAWSTPRVLALRREATIFVPQGGTKITTLFQAVEKAGGFFDSLGKPPSGRLSLPQFTPACRRCSPPAPLEECPSRCAPAPL